MEQMKYRNAQLSPEERAEDLLSRMTVEEKLSQLQCFLADKNHVDYEQIKKLHVGHLVAVQRDTPKETAEENNRLQKAVIEGGRWGIPALIHIEAVTGGMFAGATTFPTSLAQSSTWDTDLIYEMAAAIKDQIKSVGYRHALSPVFDIGRDPRWGRLTETYGEDETVSAAMASAFVRGLQGNLRDDSVAATGKHFIGHGVTEGGLNMGQNPVTERDLREVHCKPFQAAITEGGLMGVMNSYCAINREAVIASKRILTDLLRDELGFEGLLVSDYYSIDKLLNPYQIAKDHVESGILALQAGLDVENPLPLSFNQGLIEAVNDGRLDPALIDRSAKRVLKLKFQLGMFEHPYADIEEVDKVYSQNDGERIARKIAEEEIILLKNRNRTLPLDKNVKKVAVVGPHADRVRSLFGPYSCASMYELAEDERNNCVVRDPDRLRMPDNVEVPSTVLYQKFPGDIRETTNEVEIGIRKRYPAAKSICKALQEYLPAAEVVAMQGISYTGNNIADYQLALETAADADVIILTLGGQNGWGVVSTNGEGIDNSNIGLPGKQEQFARDIYKLGKKTVVVHIDGKPLSNAFVTSHFDAIIEAWQMGTYGAEELAKILFGEISPSGKLTVSAAREAGTLPTYYGMPRGSGYVGAGRFGILNNYYGYINTDARPFYYFGHGLSYSEFEYSNLKITDKNVASTGTVEFSVDIRNIGNMDADEIVQVYISDVFSSMVRPEKQLAGFKRVALKMGEKKTVLFKMKATQLAFLDKDMQWKVEAGAFELLIGASCEDIRLKDEFYVMDDAWINERTRGFYAEAAVK